MDVDMMGKLDKNEKINSATLPEVPLIQRDFWHICKKFSEI